MHLPIQDPAEPGQAPPGAARIGSGRNEKIQERRDKMTCQPVYLNPFFEDRFIAFLESLKEFSEFGREVAIGCLKYRASPGKRINYGSWEYTRSNAKIGKETTIDHEGIRAGVLMDGAAVSIIFNGISYPVIQAPEKLPKTKKTAFLKAVVRTFMDDPENILRYIPAAAISQGATQAGAAGVPASVFPVPEDLVERITGSDLPGPGLLPVTVLESYPPLIADLAEMREDAIQERKDQELEEKYSDVLKQETDRAFGQPEDKPANGRAIPHLRITITEEPIHA